MRSSRLGVRIARGASEIDRSVAGTAELSRRNRGNIEEVAKLARSLKIA